MFFMSRRVRVAEAHPGALQRENSAEDCPPEPPTPPREEIQHLLRRSRCDDDPVPARAPNDDEGGTRPCRQSEFPVHAVSPPWTSTTSVERLATLGTLVLVFGGVPYVLPVIPLVCVLSYVQVRELTVCGAHFQLLLRPF